MSTSVFEPTRAKLQKHFSDGWASATPIKFPNVPFTQPKNSPWVSFNIAWGPSRQANIGPSGHRLERQSGAIIVQVFVPKNSNESASLTYCDTVAGLLRMRQLQDATAGILIDLREASAPVVGEDKEFWMHNVSVAFQVDARF